jgi:hypothetical protein
VGKLIEDTDADIRLGFDEIDAKSPLVRYASLSDVNIARAHALTGDKDDRVIGKSHRGALLLQGRRNGTKFVALGFDVRESDLPMRVAWPLLLLNTINDFVEEDTGYISSFKTGTVFRVPAPSSAETATLVLPDGSERAVPVKDGRAVFLGQDAGFYTLRADTDAPPTRLAANLSDADESRIEPAPTLTVDGRQAGEVLGFQVGVRRELWLYLLGAVLIITAIEWLTYHRRLTV